MLRFFKSLTPFIFFLETVWNIQGIIFHHRLFPFPAIPFSPDSLQSYNQCYFGKSISKLNNFSAIHEHKEHVSDFSNGTWCSQRSISRAIIWLSTTGYKKTRLKHVYWWLLLPYYSETTENGRRKYFECEVLPCNVILDEHHPTYIKLINSSMAFSGDSYRVARCTCSVHYHIGVLCMVWWQRLPLPFTPSWLGCCRVCG